MASVALLTSFFLLIICMHFSNARLLPAAAINDNPSSAKPHYFSISHQVSEERTQTQHPSHKRDYGGIAMENAQDKKIDHRVFKEGSEFVESSSSHHVALLKGKHVKESEIPHLPPYFEKEVVVDPTNDDIVVMDYQSPHRKTPIHNK